MAEAAYTYSVDDFANGVVDITKLERQVREDASITVALAGTTLAANTVTLYFRAELSTDEQTALAALVAAHDGVPDVYPQTVSLSGVDVLDHKIRVSAEKSSAPTRNIYSHDFTDPTTWYGHAIKVTNATAVPLDTDRTVFQLPNPFVIDLTHGKVTDEDSIDAPGGGKYTPVVTVNGAQRTEVDPHTEEGDYIINYSTGRIVFVETQAVDPVVTYWYATTSCFSLIPPAGKKWQMLQAEVQFSADIEIRDTLYFQLWVWYPPLNTHVPYGKPTVFKTARDYLNDSQRAYPLYPPIGTEGNWRAVYKSTFIMDWDYVGERPIDSQYGAELRLWLQHDTPFSGLFCAASFYMREENS